MLNIRGLWNRVRFGLAAQIGLKWNDPDTISIYKSNAGLTSANPSEYLSHLGNLETNTFKAENINGVNNSLTIGDLTALLTVGNDAGEIQMKGNLIRIGSPGGSVIITGSAKRIESTDTEYKDAFIILNKGGPAGSSAEAGIGLEDDGSIVAFIRQLANRNGWEMKSANNGIVRIIANANQTTSIRLDNSDDAMARLRDIRQLGKGIIHLRGTCAVDNSDPANPIITGISLSDVGKLVMATQSYSFDPGGGTVELLSEYTIYRVIEVNGLPSIVEVYKPTVDPEHRLIVSEINIPSHNIVASYLYQWNGTSYVQYVPEPVALKNLTNVENSVFFAKAVDAGVGVGASTDIPVVQTNHGFQVGTPIALDKNTAQWVPAVATPAGELTATAVVAEVTGQNTFLISTGSRIITQTEAEWDALTGETGGLTPGRVYLTHHTNPGTYTTVVKDPVNPVLLALTSTSAIVQLGFTAIDVGESESIKRHSLYALAAPAPITLPVKAYSNSSLSVFVGGVLQEPDEHILSPDGMQLTLLDYPPEGTLIQIVYPIATMTNGAAEVGLANVDNADFRAKGVSAGFLTDLDAPIIVETSSGSGTQHSITIPTIISEASDITAKTLLMVRASARNDYPNHTLSFLGGPNPLTYPIRRQNNQLLNVGDIKPDEWMMLKFDPSFGCFILMNPSTSSGFQMITRSGHNSVLILWNGKVYSACGNNGNYNNVAAGRGLNGQVAVYGGTNFREVVIPSPHPVVKIGGSYYSFGFALTSNGELYGWGYNPTGQLGDGTTSAVGHPKLIANQVVEVYDHPSMGEYPVDNNRLFIKKTDNKIYATGFNGNGQLGVGDTTNRTTFTEVTSLGTNTVKIFPIGCNGGQTFALKSDGTIWACGYNGQGQLGVGNTTNLTTFTNVTMQWAGIPNGVLDIKVSGSNSYWDGNVAYSGFIMMMITLPDNTKILRSCGHGGEGMLGTGNTSQITSPATVLLSTDIVDFAVLGAGTASRCMMLKSNGDLYAWGRNDEGALGDGTTIDKSTPVIVNTNVTRMFSDGWAGHAYAYRATNFIKKTDGKLYACGFGTDGNLGNGTFANSSSWVKVRIPENEEVIDMSWFQTRHGGFVILAVCKSGNMYIWGYNQDSGVIPLPGLINVSIPVKIPEFWK